MKINLAYKSFSSAFSSRRDARGFALISSILIMALLVMVAMGMLSLSTIEVRSSQNSKAMAEAQANARMALMIAIGEPYTSLGKERRGYPRLIVKKCTLAEGQLHASDYSAST